MEDLIKNWLKEGPAWIKYAVEKQLSGGSPDVKPVLQDGVIRDIVRRLKDPQFGISSIPYGYMDADCYENPYWDLFFLADIGLSAQEIGLKEEIDQFLSTQEKDGSYITESGMKPSYFCKSVILLSAITRLGYQSDEHIQKLVKLLLKKQRLDGGWYCNSNHDPGEPFQHDDSCPQANLNILLLLSNYPEFRDPPLLNGAIDLLLYHWENRGRGVQIVYFGVGKRFQSLQYPATRYGILRVLDVLSLYLYARRQKSFHNMLRFVQQKSRDGRYHVEIPTPYTSLEPQDQGNRWLTFIIERIEHRMECP